MAKPVGWKKEPARHALAAKGVRTGRYPGQIRTNIAFGQSAGEGRVKASIYKIKDRSWRYWTGKPDDFAYLLLEVEAEDPTGSSMVRYKSTEVLVLRDEAEYDLIDEWLETNVNEVAKSLWDADHAHVRVVGRVTSADIRRGTGLPNAEVISRVETVADEG